MKYIEPSFEILFLEDGDTILKRLELAGRTAYKSEDKITSESAPKFVNMLLHQYRHESVIEHGVLTVKFICDRGVTHEIVRHRVASYTQESTRYCNYSKNKFGAEITLSPMLDNLTPAQLERRKKLYEEIEHVYLSEISEGVSPQQARDNLPTCLKTEIVMTANFREWRHFFELRTAPNAHPQIRKLATALVKELQTRIPVLFDDIKV